MGNKYVSSSSSSGGIGFFGLLTIAFVVLKLTGFIDWDWVWVFAPIWLPIAIVLGMFLCVAIVGLIVYLVKVLVEKLRNRKKGK